MGRPELISVPSTGRAFRRLLPLPVCVCCFCTGLPESVATSYGCTQPIVGASAHAPSTYNPRYPCNVPPALAWPDSHFQRASTALILEPDLS